MHDHDRIHQLEAQVDELTALVRQLRAEVTRGTAPAEPAPTSSRRGLLKLAGATAAGAAVGLAGRAGSVAAADGDPLEAGEVRTTTPGSRQMTGLVYESTLAPQLDNVNTNVFLVRDQPNPPTATPHISSFPAAVAGYAYQAVQHGVYGFSNSAGAGVVGNGGGAAVGVLAQGARANVELRPGGAPAPVRPDAHNRGEIVCDGNGDLWYCATGGTPGAWRKLAGPASAGSFHAVTPGRVYDSRAGTPQPSGALTLNQSRLVSVAARRSVATGAVEQADFVPAGATAVTANVTVVDTIGAGFLTVNPGGVTSRGAATINWSASGQILNNGVTLTLNGSREVTVVAGGSGISGTHVVIDVTGYFL